LVVKRTLWSKSAMAQSKDRPADFAETCITKFALAAEQRSHAQLQTGRGELLLGFAVAS
jgi:hypothetical protein